MSNILQKKMLGFDNILLGSWINPAKIVLWKQV